MARVRRLFRTIWNIPYYTKQWNLALQAQQEGDWLLVEQIMAELHERRLQTDDSHFMRGCALMNLEQWEDALAEFERIRGQLDTKSNEGKRWVNQGIALARLRREAEAAALLRSQMSKEWSPEQLRKAEQLIDQLG